MLGLLVYRCLVAIGCPQPGFVTGMVLRCDTPGILAALQSADAFVQLAKSKHLEWTEQQASGAGGAPVQEWQPSEDRRPVVGRERRMADEAVWQSIAAAVRGDLEPNPRLSMPGVLSQDSQQPGQAGEQMEAAGNKEVQVLCGVSWSKTKTNKTRGATCGECDSHIARRTNYWRCSCVVVHACGCCGGAGRRPCARPSAAKGATGCEAPSEGP